MMITVLCENGTGTQHHPRPRYWRCASWVYRPGSSQPATVPSSSKNWPPVALSLWAGCTMGQLGPPVAVVIGALQQGGPLMLFGCWTRTEKRTSAREGMSPAEKGGRAGTHGATGALDGTRDHRPRKGEHPAPQAGPS